MVAGGICKEQSDGITKPQASVSHDLRVIASRSSIHIVVAYRLRKSRLCRLLVRWTSFGKNSYQLFLPRHPTSTARRFITCRPWKGKTHSEAKKEKHTTRVCFSFLVAGVGFEPHDLRVMSPTSYQAALPRDIEFLANCAKKNGAGSRDRTGTRN